jgi:hypothetical protein
LLHHLEAVTKNLEVAPDLILALVVDGAGVRVDVAVRAAGMSRAAETMPAGSESGIWM